MLNVELDWELQDEKGGDVATLTWDTRGERFFEIGVDRGVLYPASQPGVAWTGLISVNETPTGAEERAYFIDGIKYLNLRSAEEFVASIEAFSSPSEFAVCEGYVAVHTGLIATQQPRQPFGMSYRTRFGNEIEGADYGYKIHLVYNALAATASRNNNTISNNSDPSKFNWSVTTLPPPITGYRRTAHLIIDSKTTDPAVLTEVEELLYGTVSTDPSLPTPDELIAIFAP